MARLEGAYDQVSQRLMTIDARLDSVERKIDLRFDAVDKKFETVDKKIGESFRWTIGIVVSTWLTLIGLYFRH
jgi:tetrahydromethanopterin S-methyltransferase subunit G